MSDGDSTVNPFSDPLQASRPTEEGTVESTGESTKDVGGGGEASSTRFTSESARKAVQARWERERARKALEEQTPHGDADDTVVVRVPVRKGAIIRKLEQDAAKGSVQAARELRSWLSEYPPEEATLDVAALPRALRHKLYARIIAELEEAGENDLPALPAIP